MATRNVSLRTRIPEVIHELGPRVDDALYAGAKHIAANAKARAPRGATGDLADSIDAVATGNNQAEVVAIWRWFLTEFGTSHSAAQPFMIPAVEQERGAVEGEVKAALKRLV